MLLIPVRLNDESISRFVIDRILDICDLDCDRTRLSLTKNVGDGQGSSIIVDQAILAERTSACCYRTNRVVRIYQSKLCRIRHLNTTCCGQLIGWSECDGVVCYCRRHLRSLVQAVNEQVSWLLVCHSGGVLIRTDYVSMCINKIHVRESRARFCAPRVLYVLNCPIKGAVRF